MSWPGWKHRAAEGKVVTYVEIDVPVCALNYGEAPCAAELGATGEHKCFNTLATCQDRDNFDPQDVTLRFAKDASYLPADIDAIPSLVKVEVTPSIISLGESLGTRASLTATFADHPHSDTGTGGDPYLVDREYDPFNQGTFWGKFRVRQPFLRGKPIRVIRGVLGQTLAEMETRHFVIDAFDLSADGSFTIVGKDPLKPLDADRAQAPRLSTGFLVAGIEAADTSATLAPAGIGDAEYPGSGWVAIGGKEICEFIRSGDVLTLTRGQFGTEAVDHDAQDRVQIVLRYQAVDPADILADLMQNYAGVPAEFIPLAEWLLETETHLRRVYTANIAEPTSVRQLCNELIEQAALSVWWDDEAQDIRLKVLRAILTDADRFTPSNIIAGSFTSSEQPDERVSQVWIYYAQRNPLGRVDDADNYRSVAVSLDAEAEADYGSAAIKKIFSRWIPAFGQTVALRLGALHLGRFRDPPRRFNFELLRGGQAPVPGGGYRLEWHTIQDDLGAPADAPIQLTRVNPGPARWSVEAEEQLFIQTDPEDLSNRVIIISADTLDFNMRAAHDDLWPALEEGDMVTCIVSHGVVVGASSTGVAAFTVGTWPAWLTPRIVNNGRIAGAGGRGGDGSPNNLPGKPGLPGGIALNVGHTVEVDNQSGKIYGGGGGGGGSGTFSANSFRGGGGGAGRIPGAGGIGSPFDSFNGDPGTLDAGGQAWFAGGGPGSPGEDGSGLHSPGGPGGPAGGAIVGDSLITFDGAEGDILGPRTG